MAFGPGAPKISAFFTYILTVYSIVAVSLWFQRGSASRYLPQWQCGSGFGGDPAREPKQFGSGSWSDFSATKRIKPDFDMKSKLHVGTGNVLKHTFSPGT